MCGDKLRGLISGGYQFICSVDIDLISFDLDRSGARYLVDIGLDNVWISG